MSPKTRNNRNRPKRDIAWRAAYVWHGPRAEWQVMVGVGVIAALHVGQMPSIGFVLCWRPMPYESHSRHQPGCSRHIIFEQRTLMAGIRFGSY